MANDTAAQSVLFPDLFDRPAVVKFKQLNGSSDGWPILLKACDERLGLPERLTGCVEDGRQAGKLEHTIRDLLLRRLYGIGCGYRDANDAAQLSEDPIQKLLVGSDPVDGAALASQPTLSRFENAMDVASLYRMSVALAESGIGGAWVAAKYNDMSSALSPVCDRNTATYSASGFQEAN